MIRKTLNKYRISNTIRSIDKLTAKGKYDKAIEELSIMNSSMRSPVLDRELLSLRHNAYFYAPKPTGKPIWPPVPENTEELTDAFPEVTLRELNAESLPSGIQNHGALIVRNLLDPKETSVLADGMEKALKAFDRAYQCEPLDDPEIGPWFSPFLNPAVEVEKEFYEWAPGTPGLRQFLRVSGGMLAADSPYIFNRVISLMASKGIIPVMDEYFGEKSAISVKKSTLRHISKSIKNDPNGWHQDGAVMGDNVRAVNIWIALHDCGTDAPTMLMVPNPSPSASCCQEAPKALHSNGRLVPRSWRKFVRKLRLYIYISRQEMLSSLTR